MIMAILFIKDFLLDREFISFGNFIINPSPDRTTALILPEASSHPIEGDKLYRVKFTFLRKKMGFQLLSSGVLITMKW